jgi:hypothetical protein
MRQAKFQDIAGLPQAQFGSTVSSRDDFRFAPFLLSRLLTYLLLASQLGWLGCVRLEARPTRNAFLSKYPRGFNQEYASKYAVAR